MRRRFRAVLLILLLCVLLSACRVRLLTDAEKADVVISTDSEPSLTTEPPSLATEAPETEAPETEPLPPPETEPPTPEPSTSEQTEPHAAETQPPPTEPEPEKSSQTKPTAPSPEPSAPREPDPANSSGGGEPDASGPALIPVPAPTEETQAESTEPASLSVTVTLLDNGGDTGTMTVTVVPGEAYGNLPQATRRGWSFDGWWTDAEDGEQIQADTLVETAEDHVLYAHWAELEAVTLFFDGNGGRVRPYDRELRIRYGDAYGSLPTPLREGYDFTGWWTDVEDGELIQSDSVFLLETDQTLYAHWSYNAFAYWSFLLQNGNQRRYLCQTLSLYVELEEEGRTMIFCALIDDTESENVAANRSDPYVTDDWVLAKNPDAVLKLVSSLSEAESARSAVAQRFPGKPVYCFTAAALGNGPEGLYARLALCKALYPSWYTEVDLSKAAAELGLSALPFQ